MKLFEKKILTDQEIRVKRAWNKVYWISMVNGLIISMCAMFFGNTIIKCSDALSYENDVGTYIFGTMACSLSNPLTMLAMIMLAIAVLPYGELCIKEIYKTLNDAGYSPKRKSNTSTSE